MDVYFGTRKELPAEAKDIDSTKETKIVTTEDTAQHSRNQNLTLMPLIGLINTDQ